jgi:hypothetical protein
MISKTSLAISLTVKIVIHQHGSLWPFPVSISYNTYISGHPTYTQGTNPKDGGGLPKNIEIKNNNFVNIFYEMYYMICPSAEITTEIC